MVEVQKQYQLWHTLSASKTLEALNSRMQGLTRSEVQFRLQEYGRNKLPEKKTESLWHIFFTQFRSPLIYLLIGAGMLALLLQELADAAVIGIVLLFNSIIGTFQEGKARNTLLSLKKYIQTDALVLRDGEQYIIPDEEIVPGDIILLREGAKVPADARVIISRSVSVNESALTGESEPVHKVSDGDFVEDASPQERRNMLFRGTQILAGSGTAVVVATGVHSEIGKISRTIADIDTDIPLKGEMRKLSRAIVGIVMVLTVVIFVAGIYHDHELHEMTRIAMAVVVSVIPEGLPIVLTIILATGVWRMSKRKALVKKLQAVEALGQAEIIAVDKTGTITKNELMVERVWAGGKLYDVDGSGYDPRGEMSLHGKTIDPLNHSELMLSGKISAFCSNAKAFFHPEDKLWKAAGDPTEVALGVFAEKLGFQKDTLENEWPIVGELPFDYREKYHATLHAEGDKEFLTVVGAPEIVLATATYTQKGDKHERIKEEERKELERIFIEMSGMGLRVLAVAFKEWSPKKELIRSDIKNTTFVAFVGMKDTLRSEVHDAMMKATEAGIRVVMITGDHVATAEVIGREAGIIRGKAKLLTGREIDNMNDEELAAQIQSVSAFARVTPDHKMRIINAYRKLGKIVAMTGDGVNDAPSLVAADLGVSMGKIGTEVAKEASDIVLLDDNFGSIISAIEEGRNIYKTLKKVILYLFSTNLGELFVIGGALVAGLPLPILPGQIIWLNFVTDGFLDVALAMEPKEEGLLRERLRKHRSLYLDRPMASRMFTMALVMVAGVIPLFMAYHEVNLAKAWTVSLATLAAFQWFNAWNCRSERDSIFRPKVGMNWYLVAGTIASVASQLVAIYTPFFQKLLKTVPLNIGDWAVIISVALILVVVEETRKFIFRRWVPIQSI